jgi:hypothetical protein
MRKAARTIFAMLAGALALLGVFAAAPALAADDEPTGNSFITPFPTNDVYQMQIIGDSFAEGLLGGLIEAFNGDSRVQIRRSRRPLSGMMLSEFEATLADFDTEFGDEPCHIAVVMLGRNDRVALRSENGKRAPVGSDEWRAMYSRRVDRFMKLLKRRNVAVYWVGLPNLRRSEANANAEIMNDIIRERAYLNGHKYIDAYAGFSDEQGAYSAYGPDITGKIRLLREDDGISFTEAGNRKLAHFVEREIKRDLQQAKAERTIPLAGGEPEQASIKAARMATEKVPEDAAKNAQPQETNGAAANAETAPQTAQDDGGGHKGGLPGEQKADNGKVSLRSVGANGKEEIVTLDILRPAIPASIVQLVTRKERPDRLSPMGDTVVDQIAGGIAVMSSITPAGGARRKMSPTQAPYFRLLVRGERLTPRPGRADDTSWPRADLSAVEEPVTEPAPAPAAPTLLPRKERRPINQGAIGRPAPRG